LTVRDIFGDAVLMWLLRNLVRLAVCAALAFVFLLGRWSA
jgi:hypothetical protein